MAARTAIPAFLFVVPDVRAGSGELSSICQPNLSAHCIQTFLQKSRVTETQLTIDHVEMLLRVLILDGKIETVSLITRRARNALSDRTPDTRFPPLVMGR